MSFLKRLQQKPENEKKKILWISVFFIAIILIFIWILQLKFSLKNIDFKNIKIPALNSEKTKEINENVNELKEDLKQIENMTTPIPIPTATGTLTPTKTQ